MLQGHSINPGALPPGHFSQAAEVTLVPPFFPNFIVPERKSGPASYNQPACFQSREHDTTQIGCTSWLPSGTPPGLICQEYPLGVAWCLVQAESSEGPGCALLDEED